MSLLFLAHIVPGSGTARKQRVPTLNLALEDIPVELHEGIYACRVHLQQTNKLKNQQTIFPAVMHYGPRPTHSLPRSCEVHCLDQHIVLAPKSLTIEIVERIRDIRNFEYQVQLEEAIQNDLQQARDILKREKNLDQR